MPVDNRALFQAIQNRAKKELVPKLRVGPKSAFGIHKLINWFLKRVYPKDRQDSYLTNFTTTLGYTVALATSYGDQTSQFDCWETLCHEVKHALQGKKWTRVLFGYLYLWALSQGVLLALTGWIGVFWVPGWWKALYLGIWLVVTGVHFIPQLPDPWRKRWELQAYTISMHLYHLVHNGIPASEINRIADNFTSMAYFIMEPRAAKIRQELDSIASQIEAGNSPVKDERIILIAEEEYAKAGGSRG
jgi:hypothetical protein